MHVDGEPSLYRDLLLGSRGSLDARLAGHDRHWILELQPALPEDRRHQAYRPIPHRLYHTPYTQADWVELCQFLVDTLREASGFDRVMLYRFREDDCGEVISESLIDGLSPYLGLRYPASDIPRIARDLYRVNRHRQIPDVAAVPVPILGLHGAELDMTRSDLRAVSPVHLQYLRNMEVTASLSFSLVLFGRLWGLIACHHRAPRSLPLAVRERCAEMAQVFTLSIAGYQNNRRLQDVSGSDRDISRLMDVIRKTAAARHARRAGEPTPNLAPRLGQALLSLVRAEGAALVTAREIMTFGITPDHESIATQITWLRAHAQDLVFASDALPQCCPPAEPWSDRASGLLAVRLGRPEQPWSEGERFFLWWRPEQPRTVYWAGDPGKTVRSDSVDDRLSPRSSFERWVEIASGYAEPWSEIDLLRAKKFRNLILRDLDPRLFDR